jgi:predicted nucleic acid-binding protein
VRWLLDVSLLIALLQEQRIHFGRAHDWWMANRTRGWASCPLTQNGFLRIMPQLRFPKPVVVTDALDLLFDMIAVTDHVFAHRAPPGIVHALHSTRAARRHRVIVGFGRYPEGTD